MITDADVLAAVAAHESDARDAMEFVHGHPELAHAELRCARFLTDQLMRKGLDVELGVGGMDTAFTATVTGTRPGRTVGIVCLYDAVQTMRRDGEIEAVHSCGHGVIAGSVVAAALALADHRDQLAGRLVVVGCPADEIHAAGTVARGGGKALSVEAGLWDEIDVALYSHPEFIDTVSLVSRWMRRERVRLDGARDLSGELEPPLLAAQALIGANDLRRDGRAHRDRRRRRGRHEPDDAGEHAAVRRHRGRARGALRGGARDRAERRPGRRGSPTAASARTTR